MRLSFLLVGLLMAFAAAGHCVELVQNGGFETGDTTGWTPFQIGAAPVITVSNTQKHSGNYGLVITATGGKEGGLRQVLNTTPGETVTWSAWVKGDGNGWLFMGYDLTGNTNPNAASIDWTWGFQHSDWTNRSMSFVATGTATTIFIDAWNGIGYFDDVTTLTTGTIAGAVSNAATQQPVVGATVRTSNGVYSTTTDAGGDYRLENVTSGNYTVEFRDYRYFDYDVPGVAVTAGGTAQVDAQLTPRGLGSISGVVTDAADNSPLADARVWISGIPGVPDATFQAFTNGLGQYLISGIPENTYTLNCRKIGYVAQDAQVTVNANQTTTKDWSLEWRVVDPVNALTNGNFDAAGLAPWVQWSASHYAYHQELDPNCRFGDQWLGLQPQIDRVPGAGLSGSAAAEIGSAGGEAYGACGGLAQQAYVVPGKFYRARAWFKGNVPAYLGSWFNNDFEFALGLVDGRFDPGVYSSPFDPPAHADDVVKMQCHADWFGAGLVPEPEMPWHNIVATRSRGYHGLASWDYVSTMDFLAPRNFLISATKKATGDVMTVALYARVAYNPWEVDPPYERASVFFDDVVLEEVPEPSGAISLGDLARVDISPPFASYPDLVPELTVDLSNPANAKLVTGVFADGYYAPTTYYYVEEPDRSAGIRIDVNEYDYVFEPQTGDLLNLVGTLTVLDTGERVIKADLGSHQVVSQGNALPKPVSFALKNASARLPFSNPLNQQVGPSNTGLLATVTGRVVDSFFDGYGYWLTIEDGSGKDLIVRGAPQQVANGTQVVVTGIVGIDNQGSPEPAMFIQIRPDTAAADFYTIP